MRGATCQGLSRRGRPPRQAHVREQRVDRPEIAPPSREPATIAEGVQSFDRPAANGTSTRPPGESAVIVGLAPVENCIPLKKTRLLLLVLQIRCGLNSYNSRQRARRILQTCGVDEPALSGSREENRAGLRASGKNG